MDHIPIFCGGHAIDQPPKYVECIPGRHPRGQDSGSLLSHLPNSTTQLSQYQTLNVIRIMERWTDPSNHIQGRENPLCRHWVCCVIIVRKGLMLGLQGYRNLIVYTRNP